MRRRIGAVCSGFILTTLLLAGCTRSGQDAASQRPPNVLLIAIDDLNDWVGVLGGHPHAITPNIDRLAARGALFTSAHTQAPLCGPSRASIMSGLRPSTTGIYGQINDDQLRDAHPVLNNLRFLPEYFADHGYHTMGVGKLFHQHAPDGVFAESGGREPGFGPFPEERFHWEREGTSTDWGSFPEADSLMPDYRSATWASARLAAEYGEPFFLAVGFLRPHVPWYAPPTWFDKHPIDSLALPSYRADDLNDVSATALAMATVPPMPTTDWAIAAGQWEAIVQAYLASVSFVDAQVGRVLDALDASGHADDTIVVLFSDHGYHIGEKGRFAKHSLWEPATRVPLVVAGPGVPGGVRVPAAVELLDVYPTLVDLAGLPENDSNEGESLRSVITVSDDEDADVAITTYGRQNHGLRAGALRYIRYEDGSEELYDLDLDPEEWTNLAPDPRYRHVMDSLAQRLPARDAEWSALSEIDAYEYFRDQRRRSIDRGEQERR